MCEGTGQCVVLLTRHRAIPKALWRAHGTSRKLASVDIETVLRQWWQHHHADLPALSVAAMPLGLDGFPQNGAAIQPVQNGQKAAAGVFAFSFVPGNEVKVTLREDRCLAELGVPRRPTRPIGLLRPWHPLRVLLNGRAASYSGQTYNLRECHVVLCSGPVPERIAPPRLVNLQADLM
jgi:hypothetical protein